MLFFPPKSSGFCRNFFILVLPSETKKFLTPTAQDFSVISFPQNDKSGLCPIKTAPTLKKHRLIRCFFVIPVLRHRFWDNGYSRVQSALIPSRTPPISSISPSKPKFQSTSAATRIFTIMSGLATAPLLADVPALIWSTYSIPDVTLPKAVYFPSKNFASSKQIKN